MNDYLGFKSQALDFNIYSDGVSVNSVIKEFALAPEDPETSGPFYEIKEGEGENAVKIWEISWLDSPPPYTDYPTRIGSSTEITNKGKNTYWERQITYYSNGNKEEGAPSKSTMLDVDFINALGITAKKITVLQNNTEAESTENRIIFEADGFNKNGIVKIGGFAVDQNSLHSGSNLKFAPGTTAAQITTIFKVYTDSKTGEDTHEKYLFGQQGGEIFSTSSLYNPAELPETIYSNILDSNLQKAAQSAPTILTEFTKNGLPFGQLLIYSKDIVADLDDDSNNETYNVWDKLYYNGGKWYSDTDKIWTNVVVPPPNVYLGIDKIELISGGKCFRAKDGEIFANAGTIGGFTIARLTDDNNENPADGLYSMSTPSANNNNNKRNGVGMVASAWSGDPAFWAGYTGTGNTPWEDLLWPDKTKFYVTQDGDLVTKNINATGGIIGGWNIDGENKTLYSGTDSATVGLKANGSATVPAIWAGSTNASGAPVRIYPDGDVYFERGSLGGGQVYIDSSGLNSTTTQYLHIPILDIDTLISRESLSIGKAVWDPRTFSGYDVTEGFSYSEKLNGWVMQNLASLATITPESYFLCDGITLQFGTNLFNVLDDSHPVDANGQKDTTKLTPNGTSALAITRLGDNSEESDTNSANYVLRLSGRDSDKKPATLTISTPDTEDNSTGQWVFSGRILSNTAINTDSSGKYIATGNGGAIVGMSGKGGFGYAIWAGEDDDLHNKAFRVGHSGELYCKDGKIQGSDRNIKNTITVLDPAYSTFFDQLQGVSYKMNTGTSGRKHIGFIAQDVEAALETAGLTNLDFAGVCKWDSSGTETYGLRYEEFIALNTDQIQKLKSRVAELEATVEELTKLVNEKLNQV